MMKPPPRIETFGCRLNIWESEVIRRHTSSAGLENAVVINTCAVTAEAERQARQAIRKARRADPDARIIVTGCAAQIHPDSWRDMPEVDAVLGNHEKLEPETWHRLARNNSPDLPSLVGDIMAVREIAPHLLEGFEHHTRAFLQIQQGCDHRCTFCIIPYGRGNSRSVPMAVIIDHVAKIADSGTAEVVLTGVDVTSWGQDLDGKPGLGQLVRNILAEVPQLERLRLSSIDPAEIDRDLLDVLGNDPRLMPHLHLSVQHGDDLILKRMKRRHGRKDVLALVAEARQARPDVIFGADMIAGFPTEDEAAHSASLDLIERAGLTWLHVFPFSPRDGTPAARMPQVAGDVIRARAAALRSAATDREQAFLSSRIGAVDDVLMETGGIGHTQQFARVRILSDHNPRAKTGQTHIHCDRPVTDLAVGKVYPALITAVADGVLEAELR
ncbi:tRNA (N(6)-L-threonylcarbamoyladenosine(37)-C(2))-methylthiotransferase MtaB [Alphaproteobacteria bacterium LSUCC0684]